MPDLILGIQMYLPIHLLTSTAHSPEQRTHQRSVLTHSPTHQRSALTKPEDLALTDG